MDPINSNNDSVIVATSVEMKSAESLRSFTTVEMQSAESFRTFSTVNMDSAECSRTSSSVEMKSAVSLKIFSSRAAPCKPTNPAEFSKSSELVAKGPRQMTIGEAQAIIQRRNDLEDFPRRKRCEPSTLPIVRTPSLDDFIDKLEGLNTSGLEMDGLLPSGKRMNLDKCLTAYKDVLASGVKIPKVFRDRGKLKVHVPRIASKTVKKDVGRRNF